jgi:Holliday junction resolvase RusA-like endonuclease
MSLALARQVCTASFQADALAMLGQDGNVTLFLDVYGEPVAQQRVRSRWLKALKRIVHFNPQAKLKIAFTAAVKAALHDIGVLDTKFPIFEDRPLKIKVSFRVGNAMKDIDNLLKFAFDALQEIVYGNDRFIYEVTAVKIPATGSYSTSIEVAYI